MECNTERKRRRTRGVGDPRETTSPTKLMEEGSLSAERSMATTVAAEVDVPSHLAGKRWNASRMEITLDLAQDRVAWRAAARDAVSRPNR